MSHLSPQELLDRLQELGIKHKERVPRRRLDRTIDAAQYPLHVLNQILHTQAQFNVDMLKRDATRRIERAEWNALYYEVLHNQGMRPGPGRSPVPTGVAVFAEDMAIRRYAEAANTIVHWTDFPTGGHFAALEAPELLVGDVRQFFRGLR